MVTAQTENRTVRVLFVCLGNICRSPTCEGVFRHLVEQQQLNIDIQIDSAGTGNYHLGQPPDRRAIAAAAQRGIDIGELRARQAMPVDFERFDYIIAMDRENVYDLEAIAPPGASGKIRLFMEFAKSWHSPNIPDPYYGGRSGFDRALDMIEDASSGLLADIRRVYE